MKSICLVSGGLDSCVALAICKNRGHNPVLTLSINYGQRHVKEIDAAIAISNFYNLPHETISVQGLAAFAKKTSALFVDADPALHENRKPDEMTAGQPTSYVPGRNTIMLAIAQSMAEATGSDRIYTGFNAVDYSGYPDCRPEYVEAWNNLSHYSTFAGINRKPILVDAPLVRWTKTRIVQEGLHLGAPLHLTWSCYKGETTPCGVCDSCIIRKNAFEALHEEDPAIAQI